MSLFTSSIILTFCYDIFSVICSPVEDKESDRVVAVFVVSTMYYGPEMGDRNGGSEG